jgi:hypothetical protein
MDSTNSPRDDLLKPFETSEEMTIIQNRLEGELSCLDPAVKAITNPAAYPVDFQ